jgi:D-alanine-D-alanine ligase-like ATP-grasp enzyme
MPMAGNGSRFTAAGYTDPKPLIDVKGKPMFVRAIDDVNLTFDDMIFIVRKEHNIKDRVLEHYPTAKVIELTHEEEIAAIKAASAMKLGIAGVDMLRSERGPLIIEVNSSPGLEGIESATGVDIAGQIIKYIEKNV